jgi:hypothetical protein
MKTWTDAAEDAVVSGSIACAATAAAAAWRGARDGNSAIAPINATSHVLWGPAAADVHVADLKHTASGLLINEGAGVFWAALYERLFGADADKGDVVRAFAGGGIVAAIAYVTDYHLVPKRLTPGWEERISGRSLALVYAALAISLPLRGLLQYWSRPRRASASPVAAGAYVRRRAVAAQRHTARTPSRYAAPNSH